MAGITGSGECACGVGMSLNSSGSCQLCSIPMCVRCVDGDAYRCAVCGNGFNITNTGICKCSNSSLTIN